MKIIVKWFNDQFNVGLASGEGREEFLSIKGCRIKSSDKGEFISWPSTRKDDNTYWRHAWGSDEFQAAVIREAKKSQPQEPKAASRPPKAVDVEDVPFILSMNEFSVPSSKERRLSRTAF